MYNSWNSKNHYGALPYPSYNNCVCIHLFARTTNTYGCNWFGSNNYWFVCFWEEVKVLNFKMYNIFLQNLFLLLFILPILCCCKEWAFSFNKGCFYFLGLPKKRKYSWLPIWIRFLVSSPFISVTSETGVIGNFNNWISFHSIVSFFVMSFST